MNAAVALSRSGIASFGSFCLNLRTGELRKQDLRVKLGEQPFRILCTLIEQPGELVSRDDLMHLLWGNVTHVDFDHSLNSAVQRLRDALSDSAGHARWIETVPRRGYRFQGTVEWEHEPNEVPVAQPETRLPSPTPAPPPFPWKMIALSACTITLLTLLRRSTS